MSAARRPRRRELRSRLQGPQGDVDAYGVTVSMAQPSVQPKQRGEPTASAALDHHARARQEMLILFAHNAPAATVAALINIVVIGYVMRGLVADAALYGWVAFQSVLGLLRLAATRLYLKRQPPAEQSGLWVRVIASGVVLQALGWSVASGQFFFVGTPIARTFISVMLAGMVSGGVSMLSPLRKSAFAWVLLLVLPLTFVAFTLSDVWPLFGICSLLFIFTQLAAVQHAHTRFVTIVHMDLQNQDLVASLSRTNRELERARDSAMEAAQAKSAFLANMSHEIRTPMTSILGYAELIRETEASTDVHGYADAIHRNGQHLLVLINDVLDLSKIEAGRLQVEQVDCSPTEVIDSAVDMLAESARRAGLVYRASYEDALPESIRTDPVRLRQILVNLLSNAVKFTREGAVQLRAGIDRKEESCALWIRVEDTGIGMSPDELERVFDPFTQADPGIARRYGGTGLGLSISRQLAGLLGGELTATSVAGEGSGFELRIELGPADDLAWGRAASPRELDRSESRETSSASVRRFRGRVLLAEDGPDNQRLITTLLRNRGVEVDVAENGARAIELARAALADSRPYDLILMDIQMPQLDGASAARMLKAEQHPTPIVALTAQVLEQDRARFMTVGFDGYANKPIEIEHLEQLLARHLEGADSSQATGRG